MFVLSAFKTLVMYAEWFGCMCVSDIGLNLFKNVPSKKKKKSKNVNTEKSFVHYFY